VTVAALTCLLTASATAACADDAGSAAPGASGGAVGTPDSCTPAPVNTEGPAGNLPEAEASGDLQAYGLAFTTIPLRASPATVKIVWRVSGEGDLMISSRSPSGADVSPTWLEYHGGSSYDRPGTEWGSGWVFDEPGCWTIRLTRRRRERDRRSTCRLRSEIAVPAPVRYCSGFTQRRLGKRAKSVSLECSSASYSIACAASWTSVVRLPAVPKPSSIPKAISRCRSPERR